MQLFGALALLAAPYCLCVPPVGVETIDTRRSKRQRPGAPVSPVNLAADDCTGVDEWSVCDATRGGVCRNQSCVSVCATRGPSFRRCTCPAEEDKFCYLCCGSPEHQCKPAHEYQIYKPNGEVWERDSCARCRAWPDGLSCDDRDKRRVCLHGKCASSACHDKREGSHCDMQKLKICIDGHCRDPCKEVAAHLLTCDCDRRSGFRCQLCCYDPSTKRCEPAFERYGVKTRDKRPVNRVGLQCQMGDSCNAYGLCSHCSRTLGIHTLLMVASGICIIR